MGKWTEAALKVRPIYQKSAQYLDDQEALIIKGIYFEWKDLCDEGHEFHTVKKDFKFTYNGQLYKTAQPEYTFVNHYVPGKDGTESLFTKVYEGTAGTIDNPIPAVSGMEYEYGLYYLDPDDNNVYLCQRQGEPEGGKVVLYALPHLLVGNYFVLAVAE